MIGHCIEKNEFPFYSLVSMLSTYLCISMMLIVFSVQIVLSSELDFSTIRYCNTRKPLLTTVTSLLFNMIMDTLPCSFFASYVDYCRRFTQLHAVCMYCIVCSWLYPPKHVLAPQSAIIRVQVIVPPNQAPQKYGILPPEYR